MVSTFLSDELAIPAEHDHHNLQETFRGLIAVPSYSTLQTLKRSIIEKGNIVPVPQKKHLVQIDWVSREDGSHVLTIGIGRSVLIFMPISSNVPQCNEGESNTVPASLDKNIVDGGSYLFFRMPNRLDSLDVNKKFLDVGRLKEGFPELE